MVGRLMDSADSADQAPNQQHWSYPVNFAGAVADGGSKSRKGAKATPNGDRWERSVSYLSLISR